VEQSRSRGPQLPQNAKQTWFRSRCGVYPGFLHFFCHCACFVDLDRPLEL